MSCTQVIWRLSQLLVEACGPARPAGGLCSDFSFPVLSLPRLSPTRPAGRRFDFDASEEIMVADEWYYSRDTQKFGPFTYDIEVAVPIQD